MFGTQEFDILDEICIGKKGTNLRLVASKSGKKRIESWSSMSKQWNVMYRYDVDAAWESWKKVALGIISRKQETKKPPAVKKKAAAKKPSAAKKPPAPKKPPAEKKPPAPKKPPAEKKPPAAKKPTKTSKKPAVKETAAKKSTKVTEKKKPTSTKTRNGKNSV